MISRFERFTYCLNEIDLHWHRIATAEMKVYGLKGSCAIYFPRLLENPEGLSSATLAAECGKDKADVSRDLSALEKAGFITRGCEGKSAYRAPVKLTENGRIIAGEIIAKASFAVENVGKTLSDDERAVFYAALEKITLGIRELSESGMIRADK